MPELLIFLSIKFLLVYLDVEINSFIGFTCEMAVGENFKMSVDLAGVSLNLGGIL